MTAGTSRIGCTDSISTESPASSPMRWGWARRCRHGEIALHKSLWASLTTKHRAAGTSLVQAISLLALRLEKGDAGPHLVVCPSSVVENWARELGRWCLEIALDMASRRVILRTAGTSDRCPALRLLKYAGSEAQRAAIRERVRNEGLKCEVLLTRYSIFSTSYVTTFLIWQVLLTSYSIFSSSTEAARGERRWLSRQVERGYLVLDEAQQIKNAESAK